MADATTENRTSTHKRNKKILITILCVSLFGALAFLWSSQTWKWFGVCGATAVLVNIGIYYYSTFTGEAPPDKEGYYLTVIVYGLTLVIPFSTFYIIIVWALKGFPFPF